MAILIQNKIQGSKVQIAQISQVGFSSRFVSIKGSENKMKACKHTGVGTVTILLHCMCLWRAWDRIKVDTPNGVSAWRPSVSLVLIS